MKKCSKCKQLKELSEFNKKLRNKDGLQIWCRDCNRERSRQYYSENREHHIRVIRKRNDEIKRKTKNFICEYLSEHPCIDCGESNIVVLDFDHLDSSLKEYNVSKMMEMGHSIPKIIKEIEKCEVVCANCHRKRTAQRINSYRVKYQASLAQVGRARDF